jgi:hypothetical protein
MSTYSEFPEAGRIHRYVAGAFRATTTTTLSSGSVAIVIDEASPVLRSWRRAFAGTATLVFESPRRMLPSVASGEYRTSPSKTSVTRLDPDCALYRTSFRLTCAATAGMLYRRLTSAPTISILFIVEPSRQEGK